MEKCCIDLGNKREMGLVESASPTKGPDEPSYPHLYLDTMPKGLKLPSEGQLLVTFRKCNESTHTTMGKNGEKTNRSMVLEVLSIDGVEGEADANAKKTPSQEFDDRMAEHRASKEEDAD